MGKLDGAFGMHIGGKLGLEGSDSRRGGIESDMVLERCEMNEVLAENEGGHLILDGLGGIGGDRAQDFINLPQPALDLLRERADVGVDGIKVRRVHQEMACCCRFERFMSVAMDEWEQSRGCGDN